MSRLHALLWTSTACAALLLPACGGGASTQDPKTAGTVIPSGAGQQRALPLVDDAKEDVGKPAAPTQGGVSTKEIVKHVMN